MRILCCVCYFLIVFYGVDLLVEESFHEQPPPINPPTLYNYQKPLKETITDSTICTYYSTYIKCTDVASKQITYFSVEE